MFSRQKRFDIWRGPGEPFPVDSWHPGCGGVAHTPTRRGEENIYKAPTYSQHNEEAHVIKKNVEKYQAPR